MTDKTPEALALIDRLEQFFNADVDDQEWDAVLDAMKALRRQHQRIEELERGHHPGLSKSIELVRAYTNEAREVLDETYRFYSSSKRAQDNINAVLTLLDDIEAALVPASTTQQEDSQS